MRLRVFRKGLRGLSQEARCLCGGCRGNVARWERRDGLTSAGTSCPLTCTTPLVRWEELGMGIAVSQACFRSGPLELSGRIQPSRRDAPMAAAETATLLWPVVSIAGTRASSPECCQGERSKFVYLLREVRAS